MINWNHINEQCFAPIHKLPIISNQHFVPNEKQGVGVYCKSALENPSTFNMNQMKFGIFILEQFMKTIVVFWMCIFWEPTNKI